MSIRVRLATAALVAAVCFSGGANAQRESLAERVARLEQELRESGGDEQRQTLADLVYQLNQLQSEIRELRGVIEDQGFEIENLRNSQRDQYLDLDRRLSDAASRPGSTMSPAPTQGFDATNPTVFTDRPETMPAAGATTRPAPASAPVPVPETATTAGTGAFPEVREPIDAGLETTGLGQATTAPAVPIPADPAVAKVAYEEAFDALKNRRYAEASRMFSDFLSRYPASEYADNAQYWLGESYYVTRNYRVALETFQRLLTLFPNSGKQPDARLKIGLCYYSLQNWEAAERELNSVVQDFPDSTVSRLAQRQLNSMRIEGYIN